MPAATLTNILILLAGVALVWGLLRAALPRVVFAVRIVHSAHRSGTPTFTDHRP